MTPSIIYFSMYTNLYKGKMQLCVRVLIYLQYEIYNYLENQAFSLTIFYGSLLMLKNYLPHISQAKM